MFVKRYRYRYNCECRSSLVLACHEQPKRLHTQLVVLSQTCNPDVGDETWEFLNAVPCSAVSARLDDTSLRLAVDLQIGAKTYAPHTCVCGAQVDNDGTHGLACLTVG